jgi:thiol-disulfide isomerase/thioredoxin
MRRILCVGAACLLGLALAGCGPESGDRKPSAAPEVIGEDQHGQLFRLGDQRGKVVMLDFWASWCLYCRQMAPHERDLVRKMKGRPFILVGINRDDTAREMKEALEEDGATWLSLWDGPGGAIAKDYYAGSLPTIYLIDHKGMLRYYCPGLPEDLRKLDERINKLVEEAEKDAGAS